MAGLTNPRQHLRVTSALKEDLRLWLVFLEAFNGTSFLPELAWTSDSTLHTDSAGSPDLGCAAYFHPKWCYFPWPRHWAFTDLMRDITFLELIPILLAFQMWTSFLTHRKLILHVDNQAYEADLRSKTNELLNASISGNTKEVYSNGLKAFETFRIIHGRQQIWAPDVQQIIDFVAFLAIQN
ncbi:hypothetical protein SNE40_021808 [Patella caerulea]|uniref:Uncharacterized protein n=1 Tax=Patella caerulea TaxID=87958 RepID=A0AAN8GJA1_PATCE